MSQNRQIGAGGTVEDLISIRSLALRLPSGHRIEAHAHSWGQMIYATEGVMTVRPEGRS